MRSTYKQFYYINRGRVKADGTTSIFCRITIDGKVSAIATGLYCAPEEWDTKKGEAKNARVNGQLQAFRLRIDEAYEQATKEKGIVTAEILKNVIVDANTIPMTLLATGEEERERLRLRSIRINSTSSYRQSKTSQLNLREFIGLRGMNDIAFEDLTEEFGKSYKLFLIGKGYSASNTNHNLCWLQRLVYIAVDRGLLKFNPLEDVGYEKAHQSVDIYPEMTCCSLWRLLWRIRLWSWHAECLFSPALQVWLMSIYVTCIHTISG